MKPTTIFFLKIWGFALIVSTIFIYLNEYPTPQKYSETIIHFFTGSILLLPFFFLLKKYGSAIIENIPNPKLQKRELVILTCYISFCIWVIISIFRLLKYIDFQTFPFFIAMIFGIYLFNVDQVKSFYNDQVLDDDFHFKK